MSGNHAAGPETPSKHLREPEPFTDQQLVHIIHLAKTDAVLGAFIQGVDERAQVDVARTAIVSSVAYQALQILGYRRAVAEAALKKQAEEAMAKAKAQPAAAPRIPAADIPELKAGENGKP